MLTGLRDRFWTLRYERQQKKIAAVQRSNQLRFYQDLVSPGQLVFDVGANVGQRTEVFLSLGARVVAFEPLSRLATNLESRFRGTPSVTVRNVALGAQVGEATLHVGDQTTISSMSPDWRAAVTASGRFGHLSWHETTRVQTSTLDLEIAAFGIPDFCKIDVEGFELEVLRGLSRPIPALSVEYTHEQSHVTEQCLRHLASLGDYEFAFSHGESMTLWDHSWQKLEGTLQGLAAIDDDLVWGDVYARLKAGQ